MGSTFYNIEMFCKTPSRLWWYYLWSGLELNFPTKIRICFRIWNAALALTGAIRGSSREKFYQELGLESLQLRRWYRKLCCFYKIYNKQAPSYLTELIPSRNEAYQTRHVVNAPSFSFKHILFKNTFFPSAVLEWSKLVPSLRNSASYNVF